LATPSLVRHLWQRLTLFQEKFAAKLGVSFKIGNRWGQGHTVMTPMALKLIGALLQSIGEPAKALLGQGSSEAKRDV
jgi:putative transcriptional regulator